MPHRLAGMDKHVDKSCKQRAPLSLPRHRLQRVWSVAGIFYVGEVGVPRGGQCNGADFTRISNFPEILGKLSMCKQCVPPPMHEPGNEAKAVVAKHVTSCSILVQFNNFDQTTGFYWSYMLLLNCLFLCTLLLGAISSCVFLLCHTRTHHSILNGGDTYNCCKVCLQLSAFSHTCRGRY